MATTTVPEYIQGADLPDLTIRWNDQTGAGIDFSSGYTFSLKIGTPGAAATLTKSSGISGSLPDADDDEDPNVTITWATSGELNTLNPGVYTCDLKATRSADSKDRFMRFRLRVHPAIT